MKHSWDLAAIWQPAPPGAAVAKHLFCGLWLLSELGTSRVSKKGGQYVPSDGGAGPPTLVVRWADLREIL